MNTTPVENPVNPPQPAGREPVSKTRLNLARVLIGAVILWNLQAAAVLLLWPERSAPLFELAGAPGAAAVRGIGLLFVMWNIPYAVALWHPQRQRISLYEALAMQTIGLLGETLIYLSLSPQYALARASLLRFILFDAAGLLFLLSAAWLARPARAKPIAQLPSNA